MFMLQLLDAYWHQIKKCEAINTLEGSDKFVVWAKANKGVELEEWKHKFGVEALARYEELRAYINELESHSRFSFKADVIAREDIIENLRGIMGSQRLEIEDLKRQIEELKKAAKPKRNTSKKDKA